MWQFLEKYGISKNEPNAADPIYPVAEEAARTIQAAILQKVGEQVGLQHFAKYRDDPIKLTYILTQIRLGTKAERESTVGAMALPFLVSKIEEFLGALARINLTLYPTTLGEPPSIPNSIYKQYGAHLSTSDILRWQIDQKVTELIKETPEGWRSTIAKRMGIDIGKTGADWARINEVVQRRHVITHNNSIADTNYLQQVEDKLRRGVEVGGTLICSGSYMVPMLLEVETWSICLATYWAKKIFKQDARYHSLIIGKVVDMESSLNWAHALAVLDTYLSEPLPSSMTDVSLGRINRWVCLQELGREDDALTREIEAWKPQGDDADDVLRCEVGRAALLRDYPELATLIRRGLGSNMPSFQKSSLRDAPLMKRSIRESATIAGLLQGPNVSRRQVIRKGKRHRKN
jgi:hypothetical protein